MNHTDPEKWLTLADIMHGRSNHKIMSNETGPCSMIPLWKSKRRLYRHLKACYKLSHNSLSAKELHRNPTVSASLFEFCDLFRACCAVLRLRRTRMYLMLPLMALLLLVLILFQEESSAYSSNERSPSYRRGLFAGFLPWSSQGATLETYTPFPLLQVNCPAILQGDIDQIDFTKDMLYKENHKWATDARMIQVFQNCTNLRNLLKLSQPDSSGDFPLAYIIHLQHNAYQFHLLMQTIYSQHNVYCFTLNSSASPLFKRAVRTFANCYPNIIIQNLSHNPHDTGYNVINAEMKCMDYLNNLNNWKYAMNLPEDAFPLLPNENISKKIQALSGHNYIPGKVLNSTKMWNNHLPVQDLTLYTGSQYYIVTKDFVNYVSTNRMPKQILQYFNTTRITDDLRGLYWATLNFMKHTPGGRVTSNTDTLLPVVKTGKNNSQCKAEECVVLIDDLEKIISKTNLFALGLNSDVDHVAIQCLTEYVKNSSYLSNSKSS